MAANPRDAAENAPAPLSHQPSGSARMRDTGFPDSVIGAADVHRGLMALIPKDIQGYAAKPRGE